MLRTHPVPKREPAWVHWVNAVTEASIQSGEQPSDSDAQVRPREIQQPLLIAPADPAQQHPNDATPQQPRDDRAGQTESTDNANGSC